METSQHRKHLIRTCLCGRLRFSERVELGFIQKLKPSGANSERLRVCRGPGVRTRARALPGPPPRALPIAQQVAAGSEVHHVQTHSRTAGSCGGGTPTRADGHGDQHFVSQRARPRGAGARKDPQAESRAALRTQRPEGRSRKAPEAALGLEGRGALAWPCRFRSRSVLGPDWR